MNLLKRLTPYLRQFRVKLIFVLLSGMCVSLANVFVARLTKDFFNSLGAVRWEPFVQTTLAFVGLYFVSGIFRYFYMSRMIYTAEEVTSEIQRDLQHHYMRLSHDFHSTSDGGTGISRILNDINMVRWGLFMYADILIQLVQAVGLIIYVIKTDPRLTLGLVVIVPLLAWILGKVSRSVRKHSHTQQETMENFTSTLKETFDGLRVIQSFNLENEMKSRLKSVVDRYLAARKKIISRQEFASPMTELIAVIAFAGTALYFGHRITHGDATIGHFASYIAALGLLQNPIKKLQDIYVRIQPTNVSIERIFNVLEDPRVVPEVANPIPFPEKWDQIEYRNVSFRYGDEWVVRNVNLTIKRGEVIALVGESGSGKSTLMNLLERFIDPSEGEVLIGGVPLREMKLKDLRAHIGLVTQEVFLFNESIARNIQSGNFDQEVHSVRDAAEMANAMSFIGRRPEGFETRVGERGNHLSGGEKQRVSIARAVYKNAPILILDEATSALDSASEVEVQKGLDKLMEGRTTFVIAHRLSTVVKADRIIVMERGQIVQEGSHTQLMQKNGPYARFFELQMSFQG